MRLSMSTSGLQVNRYGRGLTVLIPLPDASTLCFVFNSFSGLALRLTDTPPSAPLPSAIVAEVQPPSLRPRAELWLKSESLFTTTTFAKRSVCSGSVNGTSAEFHLPTAPSAASAHPSSDR